MYDYKCVMTLVAESTLVFWLVGVLLLFVCGRVRRGCARAPTGTGVPWVSLPGTHRYATESRVTLWQCADPCCVCGYWCAWSRGIMCSCARVPRVEGCVNNKL